AGAAADHHQVVLLVAHLARRPSKRWQGVGAPCRRTAERTRSLGAAQAYAIGRSAASRRLAQRHEAAHGPGVARHLVAARNDVRVDADVAELLEAEALELPAG